MEEKPAPFGIQKTVVSLGSMYMLYLGASKAELGALQVGFLSELRFLPNGIYHIVISSATENSA